MNRRSRTENSLINFITGIGSQVLLIGIKFISRTVFIKTLGANYLGINGLFSDILTMLSLSELGIDTAIIFKLYKPVAEKDNKRIQVLLKFYKKSYRIVGITILILGLCLIPFLPSLIKNYDSLASLGINAVTLYLLYLLESASSYFFFSYRGAIIRADQKDYVLSIIYSSTALAKNILQIISLYIWQDFMIYTCISLGLSIINSIVIAIVASQNYPELFKKTDDTITNDEVKGILKDLGALFIYKVDDVVLKATDNIVLSSFSGLTIVGIYSNYLMFYTTIQSLLQKLFSAIKASMGNLFVKEGVEKQYLFFKAMNFLTIILYGTACVGVAVLADEVIECWIGEEYILVQPFSVLMGIEILFLGIKANLAQIRNVTGAFRQMWYRPIIGIIINIVISIGLVKPYGIYGVLIGTISADVFTNFLMDPPIIYKHCFSGYKKVNEYYCRSIVYFLVLCGIGFIDSYLCKIIQTGSLILNIIIHFVICGASVPVIFCLLYSKTEEVKYLISIICGFCHKHIMKKK